MELKFSLGYFLVVLSICEVEVQRKIWIRKKCWDLNYYKKKDDDDDND